MLPKDDIPDRYDYSKAGFDPFLSRSIDARIQSLGMASVPSRQIAFDRQQVSGSLGDTLRLGRILFNGADGNIIMNDGEVDRLLLGEDEGGF